MTSIISLLITLITYYTKIHQTHSFILQPKSPSRIQKNPAPQHQTQKVTTTSLYTIPKTKKEDDENYYDLSLFSPCKINLFLRILNKRPDGFHNLASLFQTVGFGDVLHLKLLDSSGDDAAKKDVFDCNMPGVPKDKGNLVLKAIHLMRKKTGMTDKFFEANLIKQVPAQAGLGGGSGNAATAMFGVNELLGRPASDEELIKWSGELGSDITFFLSKGTAYCTGRGEILTPINPPFPSGQTKVCIIKPKVGLSTPQVFKALDYEKLSKLDPKEYLLKEFLDHGYDDMEEVSSDAYLNDLENPAFEVVPLLRTLKEDLIDCGFTHVLMSGSGTSIFGIGGIDEETGYPTKNPKKFKEKFIGNDNLNVYFTEFINRGDADGVWYESSSK